MSPSSAQTLFEELKRGSEAAHPSLHLLLDVDSTLLHVHGRNEAVFQAFLRETTEGVSALERQPQLGQVSFTPKDWGWKEPLARLGLSLEPEAHKKMEEFWEQHFFSGRFLHKDREFAGALHFLNRLVTETSVKLFYLTARDEPRMGAASRQDWARRGFPLEGKAQPWLKADTSVSDRAFKAQACRELLEKLPPEHIYIVDNEPTVLWETEPYLPPSNIYFMDSVHSRVKQPKPQWPRLTSWL